MDTYLRLHDIPLFTDLSPEALREVYQLCREEKRSTGEFFFLQGNPADTVYALVEGRVKLGQVTADGQQITMRIIGPWILFGLVAAVQDSVYPVSAEVMEDARAISWAHTTLQTLMAHHPRIAQNALSLMAGHIQEFQDRLREMASERVERRLARALLRLARQAGKKTAEGVEIDFPISRQDLAEMSGTTLFTASRILSDWERKGLVHAGRERIVIVHTHGLVSIAEDLPSA